MTKILEPLIAAPAGRRWGYGRVSTEQQTEAQQRVTPARLLVGKFVALTHMTPRGDTPLAPLPILLVLVPGPQG